MSDSKKSEDILELTSELLEQVSGGDDNESQRDEWGDSGSPGSLIDKESGLKCPFCGSKNVIQMSFEEEGASFICLGCRKEFTL